ncbi:MAG: CTAG/PCC1 family protein [archaeon]|mgnify:CR=1 FL=1
MVSKTYSILFRSVRDAHAAQDALSLETGQSYEKRARTRVRVKNNRLVFTTVGKDPASLRASVSGYSRLAEYLKNIEKGA